MNKKRVGIFVSTLLVLVMSIALLAGCGLDINFRKKVEKKGWKYSESGRSIAALGAEASIESSEKTAAVKKAIEKTKKAAEISKTVDKKDYAIAYFEFDDIGSASKYAKAMKKSIKIRRDKARYEMQKRIKELDNLMLNNSSLVPMSVIEAYNKERNELLAELNDKNNEIIVKQSGKTVSFGTKGSFNAYSKNK